MLCSSTYRCEEWVQSINRLRQLGKARALEVLRADLEKHKEDIKIMCICRLLFENTNGWQPIAGANLYREEVNTNALVQFPLFPLALSDGVPFFIYRGYNFDGRLGESGAGDLEICKNFELIPADLPEGNYEKAANKLLRSQIFLNLYKEPDYVGSSYMRDLVVEVLWEAGATNVPPPPSIVPSTIAR
jgi:hypothetical protein